jgi:hypothetical protein
MHAGKIIVKCNQSGKIYTVKVNVLSRADMEPLTEEDLIKGSQLLMDMRKRSYPVTVEKVEKQPLLVPNVRDNKATPKAKKNNMSKETTSAKSVVSKCVLYPPFRTTITKFS